MTAAATWFSIFFSTKSIPPPSSSHHWSKQWRRRWSLLLTDDTDVSERVHWLLPSQMGFKENQWHAAHAAECTWLPPCCCRWLCAMCNVRGPMNVLRANLHNDPSVVHQCSLYATRRRRRRRRFTSSARHIPRKGKPPCAAHCCCCHFIFLIYFTERREWSRAG